MNLAVFDIGGTSVKTGIFVKDKINKISSFKTPSSFEKLKKQMHSVIDQNLVNGIAISSPGNVDITNRVIKGVSAVPYLHYRPIFKELEDEFGLPVAIENDANCAGICEMRRGRGKNYNNVAFVVIGTGVGGSIFINKKLYKGSHLFGGEFGQMKTKSGQILSMTGTLVRAVEIYKNKTNYDPIDGKKLFELASLGDKIAKNIINSVYDNLAEAIYNLQVSFDFEAIIIGGGVSARSDFSKEIAKRILAKLSKWNAEAIMPVIDVCQYHNSANLYGAVYNYFDRISIKK